MLAKLKFAELEERREDRDEVHHRTRALTASGQPLPVLVVNLSPHGLMARCDAPVTAGEPIRVLLPGVGHVAGEVRWALGGRIGCQFDRPIAMAAYYDLLAVLLK